MSTTTPTLDNSTAITTDAVPGEKPPPSTPQKSTGSSSGLPKQDDTLARQLSSTSEKGESTSSRSSDEDLRTAPQKRTGLIQFIALCWCLFIAGWNDGTAGPLLPKFMAVYDIGFTVVSLLFVVTSVGFVLGAFLNMWMGPRFGFGKTLVFGACLQIITYCVQAAAPPFPAFVVINLLNGIGVALQDAQANGFVGSLIVNAQSKMGILHAAYGLGAFAAPLVSTQFSQMTRWSFHYLTSLGLALSNGLILLAVFRLGDQDTCLKQSGEFVEKAANESKHSDFRQIMTNRAVHFIGFFILMYVGVGVTLGGWIVTYIIEERGGGPSSGYIASGFFGGLTVGRVALMWVNEKVGARLIVYIYAVLCLGLEFVVWFVPSLIGSAITVSIIGVLLGPMYPLAMTHASRVIPQRLLASSIGWIAGFGQAGSALLPFMTGAVAQKHGIWSLNPLLVAMMGVMIVLWFLIPSHAPQKTPDSESQKTSSPDL